MSFLCVTSKLVLKQSQLLHFSKKHYRVDLNIVDLKKEYTFIQTFLGSDIASDPVKQQWPILERRQVECEINPMISMSRFASIKQKYGETVCVPLLFPFIP